MPRHRSSSNPNKEISGHCKIRKRVLSSSSSTTTSSLRKSHRLKRAIFVKKLVDASSSNSSSRKIVMAGSKSPMQKLLNFENGVNYNKGKDGFSARKLAASLWEINGFNSSGGVIEENFDQERKRRERGRKSSEKSGKLFDDELDQLTRSPFSEKMDGSKGRGHRRKSSASSQKLQITEHTVDGLDSVGKASSMEGGSHTLDDNKSSIKSRLKDINNSLIASKELVKVLFRILSQEEQQSSKITLASALRVELERARLHVEQLIQEQRYNSSQMDALLKQFAEEKATWKSREKERIRETVSSVARELEMERKLRRQAERLNKKLGIELAETRSHFSRAIKEIDVERRAREMLEQTCDELARGIGEERIEVEVLKKESEKVKQEAEKERQMLQLADILREERVQMKLAEARYEFEEKNATLERLKNELETYMKNDETKENRNRYSDFGDKDNSDDIIGKTQVKDPSEGEVDNGEDEEDSGDSELHSIELNMDNKNKSYKWSFDNDGANQGEVFKGRKSLSEKIQWDSICLQKKTSDGIEWNFNSNGFDKERSLEVCSNGGDKNDDEDELKTCRAIKSKRLSSCQESVSPAISTGRSSTHLREACSAILQDLALRRDMIEGHCFENKR